MKQMREEAGSQEEAPFWVDISEGTVDPCRQASSTEGPHLVERQTLPSRELYPNQGSGSLTFPGCPPQLLLPHGNPSSMRLELAPYALWEPSMVFRLPVCVPSATVDDLIIIFAVLVLWDPLGNRYCSVP